jgi:hypothetical protein
MEQAGLKMSEPRVDLHKLRALDLILIAAILLGSAGWLWGSKLPWKESNSASKKVIVYQDGTAVEQLAMSTDREISLLGGKMVLEIHGSKVRVKRSDCPRQFCVHQGWVKYDGESIICVPFKTLIEVQSAARPEVDAVIY